MAEVITREIFYFDGNSIIIKCKPDLDIIQIFHSCCHRNGLDPKKHYLSYDLDTRVDPPVQVKDFDPDTTFTVKRKPISPNCK